MNIISKCSRGAEGITASGLESSSGLFVDDVALLASSNGDVQLTLEAAARSGAPFELTALMSPGHDVFSCYHFLRKETCLVYLNGRTYVFQMCSVLMSLLSLRICSSVAVKIIICDFFFAFMVRSR